MRCDALCAGARYGIELQRLELMRYELRSREVFAVADIPEATAGAEAQIAWMGCRGERTHFQRFKTPALPDFQVVCKGVLKSHCVQTLDCIGTVFQ